MVQSQARRSCRQPDEQPVPAFFFFLIALLAGAGAAAAAPAPVPLHLEVYLNGYPTHLIAAFGQLPDKRIVAERSELEELHIRVPESVTVKGPVLLDNIPGLAYSYDEARQSLSITLPESGMIPRVYNARKTGEIPKAQSSFGAVLNYGLTGSIYDNNSDLDFSFNGASAHLDGRLFSPYGSLNSTAIVRAMAFDDASFLRLESSWSYADPDRIMVWRAGDTISGGLPWSRPIRLGGLQIQRRFSLRPDLVTMPLPTFSGSAAVPSTVDIYVNNIKSYSQDVSAGPFTINNLPVTTGAGLARIVVHDAAGRHTETEAPFYSSPKLLRKGIYDFSLEAGFPRQNYGTASNDYDHAPAAAATLRFGLRDSLTVEGHGEAMKGLLNAGAGAVTRLGHRGVMALAASASSGRGSNGLQLYGSLDSDFLGLRLHASTRRTFGTYHDLASNSDGRRARKNRVPEPTGNRPRAVDRLSLGLPSFMKGMNLSLGYVHASYDTGRDSHVANASFSYRLTRKISVFANGFYDFSGSSNLGVYAGLSFSLGDWGHASTGVTSSSSGVRATVDYSRTAAHSPGSFGWRLRTSEGSLSSRHASVTYQGSKARVRTMATYQNGAVSAQGTIDGAIIAAGGGLFLANRVRDAFAIVNAGAPDVEVMYENRPVGKTGSDGRIIVPRLRSYQENRIAINPVNLPVNADIPKTRAIVVPADRSGVAVNFNVRTDNASAIIILKSADGKVIPAGSQGKLQATGTPFVIGYDGQAYLNGLSASNEVMVETPSGKCSARFAFEPQPNEQVVIEDVTCR